MTALSPATFLANTKGLPPLGGGLFVACRLACAILLPAALGVLALSWFQSESHGAVWGLRLVKAAVLIAVSVMLLRRRPRDPVAAMLSISFLLWTISSSVDFSGSMEIIWSTLLDRCRFLFFALALLLFPDGHWLPRWTRAVAAAIGLTFIIGIAEAIGVIPTNVFLPLAIGCVLVAITALLVRFRCHASESQEQQLKWVALGLVVGVALILSARAGAAITAQMEVPLVGAVLLEGLFQLGIVIVALGFLTSLLRYRLYDAEAAISRSAVYAGLTLSLVATFAASEAAIEMLGQRYFGSGIGNISGAMAAAIAAVLLAPLHNRITGWAEQRFQHDLVVLKQQLPEHLAELSATSSAGQVGDAILPGIEEAIHATRMALMIDGTMVAVRGVTLPGAKDWARHWQSPEPAKSVVRDDGDVVFPLRIALFCPFGGVRGWLLLGPRPDGSFYGRDELDALTAIAAPLRRALVAARLRESERARDARRQRQLSTRLKRLVERIETIETSANKVRRADPAR